MDMFDMGKYGPYVWSSFALVFAVILFNEWRARVRQKRMFRDIQVRVRAMEGES